MRVLTALRALLLIVILIAGLGVAACGGSGDPDDGPAATGVSGGGLATTEHGGIVRDPAPDVGAITLPNVARGGAEAALSAPRNDGLLLVFFGFTTCPDICPTTLADLKRAIADLPAAERERLAVAMITVDPERDTPEKLTAYVQTFFPDGLALRTADAARLQAVAKDFAAAYSISENAEGRTEVVHTAFVYAIGPDGRLLVQGPFCTTSDALRQDLAVLLADVTPTPDQETP